MNQDSLNSLYAQQMAFAQQQNDFMSQQTAAQNIYSYGLLGGFSEPTVESRQSVNKGLVQNRGWRMNARLKRRREQIRAKWWERSVAATAILVVPPIVLAIVSALWRIALHVILQ